MSWFWIASSSVGSSHLATGKGCQDSYLCEEIASSAGYPTLLALVSDGAGSAAQSAIGSRLACETIRENVAQFFAEGGHLEQINKQLIAGWIELFRSEIALQSEADGSSFREYSCTLVGAIAHSTAAVVFQIGDGAIVYSTSGDSSFKLAFWPERGEYENTTFFATQPDFVDALQFSTISGAIQRLAVFSDGLQRLALRYDTQQPHQPFFAGLFPPLNTALTGDLPKLTDQLQAFLNSRPVNERTDDDKTLVLAVARNND